MTMTDPIADMLTRIRNANSAQFETVKMPGSKLKEALAAILEREGFIAGYTVETNAGRRARRWRSRMKYAPDRTRTIGGIKRVSKPGLRIYARADKIPRVLGGHRCRRGLDQPRAHDRPRGAQAPPGRRGALLCVVSRERGQPGGALMSRIGRAPISVPAGVTVEHSTSDSVTVKGPQGTLERRCPAGSPSRGGRRRWSSSARTTSATTGPCTASPASW